MSPLFGRAISRLSLVGEQFAENYARLYYLVAAHFMNPGPYASLHLEQRTCRVIDTSRSATGIATFDDSNNPTVP
jgi:hypothetical protein